MAVSRARKDTLRTAVAVVVAVAAVAAAGVALTRTTPDAPTDDASVGDWAEYSEVESATTTEASPGPAHTPEWSTDASAAYGRDFAALRAPSAGLLFDSSLYGVVDGGDVLITAVGLPDPRTYSFDSPKLLGIDAGDGTVRWSASPGGVDTCASRLTRGELVCLDSYADVPAIVAIDAQDGAMRRVPLPREWFTYGIESDGESVFILEGNPEDGESVLHGGSIDALAGAWSLPVTGFATWDGIGSTLIHVHDGRGVITLGSDAEFFDTATGSAVDNLELRSQTAVFDTASGTEVWKLEDPYAVEKTIGQTVYSQDGSSIIAADRETGEVSWTWSPPVDVDGFTASGTVVEAESGVYFVSSSSIVKLVE
ncbi:hypothetical protein CH253_04250 [Rhodococcus sp. 06-156-3C]|nr:hypothetical protein CH280_08230 [Rhodococcus sp. 06-156-4C]OZD21399.1 hypothetical protein CH248_09790 [Rhodococcus sp. 06-156-4a]OZD24053.1 hypothetical protein CH247_29215 [Rhodococcus sp. 06-156-3b]OZD25226.1 hypothetical protein CH253_04250 [Rhodococcus sp. 06-156-3C]OZD40170.1 hypothetical protein CH284_03975 [Rhodococcus sp. 06-156-3]OZF66684.1 hypothetical protein CH290_07860 [Rhodococcus sp. 06-156-4]